MKSFIPLASIALVFASCSTAYQSGQTPDDVYYSPERPAEEYVRMEKKSDKQYRADRYDYEDRDDRLVRMKIRNRLFSTLDDDWYYYDTYRRYGSGSIGYYNPYSYSYYWNYYYNPYYSPYTYYPGNYISYNPYYGYSGGYVKTAPRPVYNKPRTYNLAVFDREMNNANPNIPKSGKSSQPSYNDSRPNYRGSGSNAGDYLRNVFSSSDRSSDARVSAPPSSNNSSGSTSSSGSSSSSSGSNTSRGRASRGN